MARDQTDYGELARSIGITNDDFVPRNIYFEKDGNSEQAPAVFGIVSFRR